MWFNNTGHFDKRVTRTCGGVQQVRQAASIDRGGHTGSGPSGDRTGRRGHGSGSPPGAPGHEAGALAGARRAAPPRADGRPPSADRRACSTPAGAPGGHAVAPGARARDAGPPVFRPRVAVTYAGMAAPPQRGPVVGRGAGWAGGAGGVLPTTGGRRRPPAGVQRGRGGRGARREQPRRPTGMAGVAGARRARPRGRQGGASPPAVRPPAGGAGAGRRRRVPPPPERRQGERGAPPLLARPWAGTAPQGAWCGAVTARWPADGGRSTSVRWAR